MKEKKELRKEIGRVSDLWRERDGIRKRTKNTDRKGA